MDKFTFLLALFIIVIIACGIVSAVTAPAAAEVAMYTADLQAAAAAAPSSVTDVLARDRQSRFETSADNGSGVALALAIVVGLLLLIFVIAFFYFGRDYHKQARLSKRANRTGRSRPRPQLPPVPQVPQLSAGQQWEEVQ